MIKNRDVELFDRTSKAIAKVLEGLYEFEAIDDEYVKGGYDFATTDFTQSIYNGIEATTATGGVTSMRAVDAALDPLWIAGHKANLVACVPKINLS